MRICATMLAMLFFAHASIAQEPIPRLPALPASPVAAKGIKASDALRKTSVYHIENASALDVANRLNEELTTLLDKKPKHNGFVVESPVVIIPEARLNCLLVVAEPQYMDKIGEMIRKLDKTPTLIMVDFQLEEIVDGKATIVSEPKVVTFDGNEAIIHVGSNKKAMRIKLTPRVVQHEGENSETKRR